jgi:hypothetical protein
LLQALVYLLVVSVVQLFVTEFVLHAVFARRRRSDLGLDLEDLDLEMRCLAVNIDVLAVEIGVLRS